MCGVSGMSCVWCAAPRVAEGPHACGECGHWTTGDVWTAATTLQEVGASVARAFAAGAGHPGVTTLVVIVGDDGVPMLAAGAGVQEVGTQALCLCGDCESHIGTA